MENTWIIIAIIIMFLIMGIVFLMGKGGFLIAGYNTASKKEKEKYDERKLNYCYAIFSFAVAAVLGITAYVDTDEFALKFFLPVLVILIICLAIISSTYCKKR